MRGLKANIPVVLYIGKIFMDKIGRKGIRINGSLVKTDNGWKHHIHFSAYAEPCTCLDCQPVVKGLLA